MTFKSTIELVCRDCVKGRKVLSSTVIPADERNHSIGATISTGGKMQADCGHFGFTLYSVHIHGSR
jgi:hypothetical protein